MKHTLDCLRGVEDSLLLDSSLVALKRRKLDLGAACDTAGTWEVGDMEAEKDKKVHGQIARWDPEVCVVEHAATMFLNSPRAREEKAGAVFVTSPSIETRAKLRTLCLTTGPSLSSFLSPSLLSSSLFSSLLVSSVLFSSLLFSSLDPANEKCRLSVCFQNVERDLPPFSCPSLLFSLFCVSDCVKRGLDRASPGTLSAIPNFLGENK